MITETVMVLSAITLAWAGFKVNKSYKELGKKDLLFLSLFFLGAGLAITLYTLRMIFVQHEFIDIIFYKIGGVSHVIGMISAMFFGFLMFQPRWYKKLSAALVIFIIFAGLYWMLWVDLRAEEIPLEPYEPLVVKRTEIVYVGEQMLLLALIIFIPMLIPVITFILHALKTRSKHSLLFAFGFALHAIAISMDAMAPWPSLLFIWRLLYGVSAFVIYKAFSLEK